MTKGSLVEYIKQFIILKKHDELRRLLVKYREEGGTKKEAIEAMSELFSYYENSEPDLKAITEVADYITGLCNPVDRIWAD